MEGAAGGGAYNFMYMDCTEPGYYFFGSIRPLKTDAPFFCPSSIDLPSASPPPCKSLSISLSLFLSISFSPPTPLVKSQISYLSPPE